MSNYFELKGKLNFPNEDAAKQTYDMFLNDKRSLFYVPAKYMEDSYFTREIISLVGKKIRFDEKNYAAKEAIDNMKDLINKAIDLSKKGNVQFIEGSRAEKNISCQYKSSI